MSQINQAIRRNHPYSRSSFGNRARIRNLGELSEEVPIVVLPSEYEDEKEGSDEPMGGNDYKSYMTTVGQLEGLLKKTLQTNSGILERIQSDEQSRITP